MHRAIRGFVRSKVVVGIAAIAAFVVFCIGATIAFGQKGPQHTATTPGTQPDTRPTSLTVVTGGDGLSSTDSAAALQSQSAQSSDLSASAGVQSNLMGQTGGVSLQAGIGDLNSGVKTPDDQLIPSPGFRLGLP